jgi:hypothetical protein
MIATMRMGWGRSGGRAALAVGLLVALAAGCADDSGSTSGDSEGNTSRAALTEAAEPNTAGQDEATTSDAGGSEAATGSALDVDTQAIAAERDIVRTGSMQLRVDDAEDGETAVARIATDAGGFVSNEQARVKDHQVDITVRVPADHFEDVRADIADLGDVVEQTVDAQDVTAQVVDIDSRVASLQRSVERLQGLLSEAGDVGQLATVEGELARRETELEALQGQQRVLADQVALGTLEVHLSEDDEPVPSSDTPGFSDGLRRGWVALVDGGRIALAGVGFALPFLIPAALAYAVFRLVRRRMRPPTPAEQSTQV